jgi:hypothetical protein
VFTDADHTKLNGIESGATANQTDEEIQDIVGAMVTGNTESGITVTYQDSDGTIDFSVASQTDNNFTNADHSKLDGIEAGADVTDATNVTAAGALMDSEVTNLAQVKAFSSSDYATAAQGTKADTAHGWGNHASAGYLTSHQDISGKLNTSGGTLTGDLTCNESLKVLGGAGATIGGSTFNNGWLQVGTSSAGIAFDNNEMYVAGQFFIGALSGGSIQFSSQPKFAAGINFGDSSPTLDENGVVLRLQTTSGYLDLGAANSTYCHLQTDRGKFYFNKPLTVDGGVVSSYDENLKLQRNNSTDDQIEIQDGDIVCTTDLFDVRSSISLKQDNSTATRYVHLPRGGGITFYGDSSAHHGMFSRSPANSATDDILISSYGGIHLDLDSNNNNTSAASFTIGRHNGAGSQVMVDGEKMNLTMFGVSTSDDAGANIICRGSNAATSGYQPQNWHLVFQNAGGTAKGRITSSSYSTQFTTTSDYRLKEDVKEIADATDKLKLLKPCNFKWTEGEERSDGFIAHELQEVIPEAVTGVKDEMMEEDYEVSKEEVDEEGNVIKEAVWGKRDVPCYQGIDQAKVVPILVKAVQDLLATVEAQEARIVALENK